ELRHYAQFTYVSSHGFTQCLEIVTTLQTRNETPIATRVRPLLQCPRHVDKIFIHKLQLPQRIAEMGIKACGDDDQVRFEVCRHLIQRRFKASLVFDRWSRRTKWQIQCETLPAARSLLAARAGARIPRILMRR